MDKLLVKNDNDEEERSVYIVQCASILASDMRILLFDNKMMGLHEIMHVAYYICFSYAEKYFN